MAEFNLFETEERLIEQTRDLLVRNDVDGTECHDALVLLLSGYERLFREARNLIRLSDRREHELNRLNKKLRELMDILEYQASHDPLTDVLNKGAASKLIEHLLSEQNFGLIILDIDYFKRVNDSYGHMVGDALLKDMAQLIKIKLKNFGTLGRFGGEEFIIVLPDLDLTATLQVAEDIRRIVEITCFHCAKLVLSITISLGVTLCRTHEEFNAVYARADGALYTAKRNGRNRVEVSENRHFAIPPSIQSRCSTCNEINTRLLPIEG